ncbi:pyridoxal phosphate-dependent aminotransferase [Corynebacterium diphtheriae]|uniref:pyridoxal phosphate-dependent aminotransferase n=1 Tax=Corynebacterium diphtheriae TaxID=1717 RepID=UPI000EB4BF31|nr:pyridoxal phosphate-dependent aminotransferase [Corynebacterium diphtheriae]RKW97424.1 pyridoxal phosphate-dependent aminotransferase [Corynebacterium diphtheriae]CAB0948723.1 aminotransferase [Corynebacterium diphtheriae]CAB0948804.1 aminotransferase [Corynebacterium diphtheriae]
MIRKDLSQIPTYVPGKRNDHALKLSSNEVTHRPLPSAAQAMAEAAAGANRYPDMGVTELRGALSEHLGVPAEQIAVGCGSSALCQQLVQITCTPGDEVVFPWRSFEAYPIFVQVVGATPVAVPLTSDGFNDLDAMAAAITPKTKLVFVCNPNNPSGTVVRREAFLEFMAKVPADVVVALDEAYTEYVRDEDTIFATEILGQFPNLVGLRTFSKAFGLAGVRVGYAFGPHELIDALNKVALPFGVNAVGQAGALASLNNLDELMEHTEEVVAVRDHVADHIGAAHSQANFVWIPAKSRSETPFEIAEKLAGHDVLVRAFPEGVRITVTNEEESDRLLAAWDASFA